MTERPPRRGKRGTERARRRKREDVEPEASSPPERPPFPILNRELSHLEFQARVLEEARDERNPLVERARFLSIFHSNMDEFFMVRVAGLLKQLLGRVASRSPDGLTPAEQLAAVRRRTQSLMTEATEFYARLKPQLVEAGIHVLDWTELNPAQQARASEWFHEFAYPVLTPLAFDTAHPFPHISNLSLNLAVVVDDGRKQRFARVKVPETLPRLVPLKRSSGTTRRDGTNPSSHWFVWLEQVIAAHLDALFPGLKIVEVHPFHITRDADTEIQELEADDLLELVEESVRRRRFGTVVRLMFGPGLSDEVRTLLLDNLDVDDRDVYVLDGPLALADLKTIGGIEAPELRFPPYVPVVPRELRPKPGGTLFDRVREADRLLHHPYDSFVPLVDFLAEAARDPEVLAIKQTLYRVGRDSPVVQALLDAREEGKQVSVLVELKARFDEESNIEWARRLEEAGVHVVYGLMGLKTHSKVALVVRREGQRIRRYLHLATGNYNNVTAQIYEDIGLLTVDEALAADVTDLFNYLTGYSAKTDYRKLLVAPVNLRERLEALTRREIEHARAAKPARLVFKVNSLVDRAFIELLYEAAKAGVQVDLIVRGICCLVPHLPGMRVLSVLGRYLEHSRIFYFGNGGADEVYLGSADLMPRNLDHRVEVVFPVESPELVRHLRDVVLAAYLADNVRARRMQPDGSYARIQPQEGAPPVDVQATLAAWHQAGAKSRRPARQAVEAAPCEGSESPGRP